MDAAPKMSARRYRVEEPLDVPFFQRMGFDDACALKRIAELGGDRHFVRAPDVAPSRMRSLARLNLIDTGDAGRGLVAMLTEQGRMEGLPAALKIIAAGPGRGA